jgi:hypothetical protein
LRRKESETSLDKNINACKGFSVSDLDDGIYDAIVIDAVSRDDDIMMIEIALSSGAHRGEVVRVNATHIGRSWTDLLAAPVTLIVESGRPRLTFDT